MFLFGWEEKWENRKYSLYKFTYMPLLIEQCPTKKKKKEAITQVYWKIRIKTNKKKMLRLQHFYNKSQVVSYY